MVDTDRTTVEEPGKAETGRKKRIIRGVGGPGVLLGALAVAFVIGAAIRIRRYRSLRKAGERLRSGRGDYRNGDRGLLANFQAGQDHPHQELDATSETSCPSRILVAILTNNLDEVGTHEYEEDEGEEASETDGEWMTREVSEDSGHEEEDGGECLAEKYEETEESDKETEESDEEEVRPEQKWPPEFKEMKISHHGDGTGRYLNEMEREKVTVRTRMRIWFWTTLTMLLLLLLLSSHQSEKLRLIISSTWIVLPKI